MGSVRLHASAVLVAVFCAVSGCTGLSSSHPASKDLIRPIRSRPSQQAVSLSKETSLAIWTIRAGGDAPLSASRLANSAREIQVGKSIPGAGGGVLYEAAMVFRPPTALWARCLTRAELSLDIASGLNLDTAELAVYPALHAAALAQPDGRATHPPPLGLLDNRPRGYVSAVTAGWTNIDITSLYRTWARGGPFPSENTWISPTSPFAVIVRPPTGDDGIWRASVSVDGEFGPRLTLTRMAGCT
jgi:hypothetical protein